MSINLHVKELREMDVPEKLDLNILAYARQKSIQIRRRRVLKRISFTMSIAAVVAVFGAVTLFYNNGTIRFSNTQELIAMNDWSNIDQENYNLCCELNTNREIIYTQMW